MPTKIVVAKLKNAVQQIVAALTSKTETGAVREPLVADTVEQAYRSLRQDFDKDNGGFGTAPKFPQPNYT